MSVDIYGLMLSQPVRSLVFFCRLSGIPFNFHNVNLSKSEHLTEEFKAINPTQTVPCIVHDGYSLWESGACVSYLADAFNIDNQYYPKDPKKRGRINAYLHWHHSNTRNHCRGTVFGIIIGVVIYNLPPVSEETKQKLLNDLRSFLEYFNQMVNGKYLCGDEITIADIFAFNELVGLELINLDLNEYEHISKWMKAIMDMPVVQESLGELREFKDKILSKIP